MHSSVSDPGAPAAGIDLGGTKCLGVVVLEGEVVAEARVETPHAGDGEAVIAAIAEVIGALAARGPSEFSCVGVGAPGLVDRQGVLRFAPNLPGGTGLALGRQLENRLGRRVIVDNDATCAAWGEALAGAARGVRDAVVATLGTGIGGGIISGGRLCRGVNGFAGEIGHMVVDPAGPPCPCGQRGCWERFASGSGLARLAREAAAAGRIGAVVHLAGGDAGSVRGEHVTMAAERGDAGARGLMAEFARWLALGLVNLANIFDPQRFVLGGGLLDASPVFMDSTRETFAELLAGRGERPPIDIVPAALGERAGAIGAALLFRSRD